MTAVSRRAFVASAPGVCAASGILGFGTRVSASPRAGTGPEDPYLAVFPRQDAEAVREIVGASHGKLERVREMVTARPALAKAAWDWGFGDWESALGAASHTGQREIAELLLAHGARPDIFAFAMLGNLAAVKTIVEANPGVQRIPGPHGIPLLAHAKAGGERAAPVGEYLEQLGDAGIEQTSLPLTDEERAAYFGTYHVEGDEGLTFEIKDQRGRVAFERPGQSFRGLFNLGNHEFHPVGANAVRLRFEMESGRAAGVTVTDGGAVVRARRVG